LKKLNSEEVIAAISLLPGIRQVEHTGRFENLSIDQYKVEFISGSQTWKLVVQIADSFPLTLPNIWLANGDELPPIGHVNWHGLICYKDRQGVVIRRHCPEDVIRGCIVEAIRTVDEGSNDQDRASLYADYEAYFESIGNNSYEVLCFIDESCKAKEVNAFQKKQKRIKAGLQKNNIEQDQETWHAFSDVDSENKSYFFNRTVHEKKTNAAIFLPLVKPVALPRNREDWNASSLIKEIIRNLSDENLLFAKSFANKQKWRSNFPLILSHQKVDGSTAKWAVEFSTNDTSRHPLIETDRPWKVRALRLKHCNTEYLLERGGAIQSLADKKVLIIGCGSVGGSIAFQIAKSGVGSIHICDPDIIDTDNLYRHILGSEWIGDKPILKSQAMACQLNNSLPNIKCTGCKTNLLSLINHSNDIKSFDLVIVATGEFTHELAFNEFMKGNPDLPPVIYAWQDGFGIGGHAIIVSPSDAGCLECLYTTETERLIHPKTSFIEPGQVISKHIGGCIGSFTPYSFIDATQTAIIAARLALESLETKVNTKLTSWKGSANSIEANGYRASRWYEKSQTADLENMTNFISDNCVICGGHHKVHTKN
jgi:molybdopterin-synthase adenylyltransferase